MPQAQAPVEHYDGQAIVIPDPHGCGQIGNIHNISETLNHMMQMQIDDRKERRESEARMIATLEKVADQGARIDHIEDTQERSINDMEKFYERVRDLELNQAANGSNFRERVDESFRKVNESFLSIELKLKKLNTILAVTTSKYVLVGIGFLILMIVGGFALDVIYHYDTIKKAFSFIHMITG